MAGPVSERRPGRKRKPAPLLRTVIGQVLRRTRLQQHRTLADVAKRARVSMPYLSEIERGRKEASSEVLAAVCEALQIGLPELLAAAGRRLAGAEGGLAGAGRRLAGADGTLAGAGRSLGAPGQAADRPAPVIRLDVVRGGRAHPRVRPSGDAQARLAA